MFPLEDSIELNSYYSEYIDLVHIVLDGSNMEIPLVYMLLKTEFDVEYRPLSLIKH